jgi:hypothetical protein
LVSRFNGNAPRPGFHLRRLDKAARRLVSLTPGISQDARGAFIGKVRDVLEQISHCQAHLQGRALERRPPRAVYEPAFLAGVAR